MYATMNVGSRYFLQSLSMVWMALCSVQALQLSAKSKPYNRCCCTMNEEKTQCNTHMNDITMPRTMVTNRVKMMLMMMTMIMMDGDNDGDNNNRSIRE